MQKLLTFLSFYQSCIHNNNYIFAGRKPNSSMGESQGRMDHWVSLH